MWLKKLSIFDNTNYIDNIGIMKQVFQRTAKVILLAKMIKLWTLYENVIHSQCERNKLYRLLRQELRRLMTNNNTEIFKYTGL